MNKKHLSPTEFSRVAGVSKQAIFDAIESGLIPFTGSGKTKHIDPAHPSVVEYLRATNRQREQAKTKKPSLKPSKKSTVSPIPSDFLGLDAHEMNRRAKFADMRKRELQVLVMEKKYLPIEFIDGVYIKYLESFNAVMERNASTFIQDVGKQILEAGEVLPEHIEKFTSLILEAIHENKKDVKKQIKKYEPSI